jgi:N-acetylglutamate synthase-like GNAT family acetyltransferase
MRHDLARSGMTGRVSFRPAEAADAADLGELAFRSKAHWGYPEAFMRACREELSVSASAIESDDRHFVVALQDHALVGYYCLEDQRQDSIELGGMFVEPECIGTGIGRQLMARAIEQAAQLGARSMIIQADPNAVAFYRAAGAQPWTMRESDSIPGRMLPLLRLQLPEAPGRPAE